MAGVLQLQQILLASQNGEFTRCKELLVLQLHSLQMQAQNHAKDSTELLDQLQQINNMSSAVVVSYMLAVQADNLTNEIRKVFVEASLTHISAVSVEAAQFCQTELVIICHKLVDIMCTAKMSSAIIQHLVRVVTILAPNSNCLTAVHADVLQACISSQMYTLAMVFIESHEVLAIAPKRCVLPSCDYLRYFYYCGISFIACKRFEEAQSAFITCISTPANAVSSIVFQSLKKARLVSLILTGKDMVLPSNVPSLVSKASKAASPGYDEICNSFLTNDSEMLLRSIEESGRAVLEADHNYGLARQVYAWLFRHRVIRLTGIYTLISFEKLNNSCSLGSTVAAETLVMNLIEEGVIRGKVNKTTGLVDFSQQTAGDRSNADVMSLLRDRLAETMTFSDDLRALHSRLLSSKAYVQKASPRSQEQAYVMSLPGEEHEDDW